MDACKTALDDGFTHYTSFGGIPELRKALADKLQKENGVQVDPENQVVVTPGDGRAVRRRPGDHQFRRRGPAAFSRVAAIYIHR